MQTGIDWVPQSIDGRMELIGLDLLFPGSELINPLRIHLVVNLVTYDVKIKLLNMFKMQTETKPNLFGLVKYVLSRWRHGIDWVASTFPWK